MEYEGMQEDEIRWKGINCYKMEYQGMKGWICKKELEKEQKRTKDNASKKKGIEGS